MSEPSPPKGILEKELGVDDFISVWSEVSHLTDSWDSIGIMLGIHIRTIKEIEDNYPRSGHKCLREVFTRWLQKGYNYKKSGIPTWLKLCECIRNGSGGNDPALAEELMENILKRSNTSPFQITSSSSKEHTPSPQPNTTPNVPYVKSSRKLTQPLTLEQKIQELQSLFGDNLLDTKKHLQSCPLPDIIEYIEFHIVDILSPRMMKDENTVQEDFEQVKTLQQFFKVLKKYVSWFNFDLIVKLVNVFLSNNQELMNKWSTYREKLKDYFNNDSNQAIQVGDSIEFGLSDVPGTKVMIAKVARDDYKLNDLYFFHKAIANALEIPEYPLYFCRVEDGCMELKYSIPDYLYSILFPLTNKQWYSLAKIGLTKITCGDYVRDIPKLPTDCQLQIIPYSKTIDINDPLWYENTSIPLHETCWKGRINEVKWLLNKFGYEWFSQGLNGWTPPLSAAYGGHMDILRLLNDHSIDMSQGDNDSVTTLHMASYKGHLNIVEYLLNECHIDPDRADSSGNTALLYSALGGHVDLVTLFIIKKKCNVSQCNREGADLSLLACKSGQVALVRKLKLLGVFSVEAKDYFGRGIIHYSCMSDSVQVLQSFIDTAGVGFDIKDRYGRIPLHIACQFASSGNVTKLIEMFGDKALLETDYRGQSCLHYLCDTLTESYCSTEVYSKLCAPSDAHLVKEVLTNLTFHLSESIKCFIQNFNSIKQHDRVNLLSTLLKKTSSFHNFNINSITFTGQSLLHLACTSGSTLLVKVLEEYNINTSLLDYEGQSVVHRAALSGSSALLNYVITQYELDATQTNYKGIVPLAFSCMSGSINAVEYLINTTEVDIDIVCDEGMTPLHYSCQHGHLGLTQYLIEVQGSDVYIKDGLKCDALIYSALSGNMKLVHYLISKHQLPLTSSALLQAVMSTKLPLVKELVNVYNLDPNVKVNKGKQPVHFAAQVGAADVLDYLVQVCGCDLSVVNDNNLNIYHFSTGNGHVSFFKHIIDHYPQCINLLHSKNTDSILPIHKACQSGIIQLVTFFIDVMKCDITTEDKWGYSCVTYACLSGNLDLVKLLIKHYKLSPNVRTSLLVSVMFGHVHIMEWLREEYPVNVLTHINEYLPFDALYQNKFYCLKYLLNTYTFDINATNPDNTKQQTLLHLACERGHVAIALHLTSLPHCNLTATTSDGSNALHLACKSRSLPILKHLVEKCKLDLCTTDLNGKAPVHIACEQGTLNILKYIIEHSQSSLNLTDAYGCTPLLTAAFHKHLSLVRYLNSQKCNISILDDKGFNVIHVSAERGCLNILGFFVDGDFCDPDLTDNLGRTPLYLASQEGHLHIVDYLLDSPSYQKPHVQYVEMPDTNGNTPLHAACQGGHPKVVSTIVGAYKSLNINIYQVNEKGETPLHIVSANGHINTATALLSAITGTVSHETLLTAFDREGFTALHLACKNGHYRMVLYLCEVYPAGVNTVDNNGRGLLHAVVSSGSNSSLELVQLLVQTYALDPEAKDKDDITCLHLIAEQGNVEIYQYLQPHIKTDPIPLDKRGQSPLHYAAKSHLEMSLFLIKTFGCHPEDKDSNGFTPLHAACQAGNMKLVIYYLNKLKCDPFIQTSDSKSLLYFACQSCNFELVYILVEHFKLKPRPSDIAAAKSVKADDIVQLLKNKFALNKLINDWIREGERRGLVRVSTKLPLQYATGKIV